MTPASQARATSRTAASRRRAATITTTFGEALRAALADREMSQLELAERLGLNSQSVVSQWISGTHKPEPARVFELERQLEVEPGRLSRLLGYLPTDAVPVLDVPSAIANDPHLNAQQREAVLAVYRALARPAKRRRR
jgi:transcriptional regulator with XRE-family HTH domain